MKLLNLASNNSFWRGIDYHHENRIITWQEIDKNCYQGKVRGSDGNIYDVVIDTVHPKKSVCNCQFAKGRRVICKHMVALDLGIFPEKEQQMMDFIEEEKQIYKQQQERAIEERREEIVKYVMSLSKSELRQELIRRMINDLYY